MQIRNLLPEDYPAADALMQQLHQIHLQNRPDLFRPFLHPYTRGKFVEMTADSGHICLAAVEDAQIVGICLVSIRTRSNMVDMLSAYVDDLVVNPAYQRRGIAAALLEEVQTRAKAKGAQRLDLMVWSFNKSALRFYQALGMTPQRYILEKEL
ncbi:MAG TPA: GNAT family N-acetyltransferase [Candidatus Faecousia intestinigallinarum]|nr:GNAT family N-acetyltransferase [Candidatus Faecousia intestinigallinarum]